MNATPQKSWKPPIFLLPHSAAARTDKDFSAAKLLLDSHGIANGLSGASWLYGFSPETEAIFPNQLQGISLRVASGCRTLNFLQQYNLTALKHWFSGGVY